MSTLLSVADALRLIEQHANPLKPRRTPLAEALGLVLSEDVASDIDSPPHDKAMMDGFAIRSGDGAAERRIVEEVFAGDVPTIAVGEADATRIMTGAPLPEGADAVVPVEQTEATRSTVRLTGAPPPPGRHVALRGELIRSGETVLSRGAVVRSAEIALLAEVGCASVTVQPKPTVAVLPTGAELVAAHQQPGPGQIRNSNGPMLIAAVAEAGGEPRDAGVATDDEASLRAAIESAARDSDVLLLSGGVSAGDRDLAPGVLADLGVEKIFHKVAVKPGKPLWFGVWRRDGAQANFVFGLPGNPVSSYVCFQLFVRPLLAALAGKGFLGLPRHDARLTTPLSHRGGRETYLPARLEIAAADLAAAPTPWRGSADLCGLSQANALIRLPVEPLELAAGATVTTLALPGSTP